MTILSPTELHDDVLLEYATPTQRLAALTVRMTGGNIAAAAKELGKHETSVRQALLSLKKRAARMGYAPGHAQTRPVPEGQRLAGVSTLYNAAGEVSLQWVKSAGEKALSLIHI